MNSTDDDRVGRRPPPFERSGSSSSPIAVDVASSFVPPPSPIVGGGRGRAVATVISDDDEYDIYDIYDDVASPEEHGTAFPSSPTASNIVVCAVTPVKSQPLSTVDEGRPMMTADDDEGDASSAAGNDDDDDGGGGGGGRRRGRGRWAGIGFGGPISVAAGGSPAPSSAGPPCECRGIDVFENGAPKRGVVGLRGDGDPPPAAAAAVVSEDDEADDDENNARRSGVPLARRAVRDCRAMEEEEEEELPIDPSRLFGAGDGAAGGGSGGIASISSAVTREGCIDLARRLGRIESGLLEAAGEPTRSDAFRALAEAARGQAKRADSIGRRARRQERKIDVLEALCEKLMTTNREDATLRSSMRAEMDALGRENARLVEKLRASEAHNAGMNARAREMSERLRRMEGENVRISRLLLDGYPSSANDDDGGDPRGRSGETTTGPRLSEFDEYRRRAEGDRAEIDRLGSEMARMIELHARREGRSERKVALLMEIKSAMEEQIRFLEGGGGTRTMSRYDDDYDVMGRRGERK